MFQIGDLVRCVDDGEESGYNNPPIGTIGVVTTDSHPVAGRMYCHVSWFIDGEWERDYMEEEIEHVVPEG